MVVVIAGFKPPAAAAAACWYNSCVGSCAVLAAGVVETTTDWLPAPVKVTKGEVGKAPDGTMMYPPPPPPPPPAGDGPIPGIMPPPPVAVAAAAAARKLACWKLPMSDGLTRMNGWGCMTCWSWGIPPPPPPLAAAVGRIRMGLFPAAPVCMNWEESNIGMREGVARAPPTAAATCC